VDFFTSAKLFWILVDPGNLLLLILCVGLLLRLAGRLRRFSAVLMGLSASGFLVVLFMPVGQWLLGPLENRFPVPSPASVDGIVVLSGVTGEATTTARNAVALNDGAERLTATVELARRFPTARIVISGGSGRLGGSTTSEAEVMRRFLVEQGVEPDRIETEEESRNTAENANLTIAVAAPQPGETWLLVTSAAHMPRAIGSFRQAGWDITAYPVDYVTPQPHTRHLGQNLVLLGTAEKEWLGLLAYYLTGRSQELVPGPATPVR